MSISVYFFSSQELEVTDLTVTSVARANPQDYESDFRVSEVMALGEREKRLVSDFEFPSESYFIVSLNKKSRGGTDFHIALERFMESLGEDSILVLYEGETPYVPRKERTTSSRTVSTCETGYHDPELRLHEDTDLACEVGERALHRLRYESP